MHERLRKLLEERARVWAQARAIDEAASKESRDWTAEERASWDKANADLNDLDQRIADVESLIKREAEAKEAEERYKGINPPDPGDDNNRGGAPKPFYETDEYAAAFRSLVIHGRLDMEPDQRKLLARGRTEVEGRALGTGSGSIGGYTVPQGFYNVLTTAMKAYGGMVPPALDGGGGDGGFEAGSESAGTSLIRTESGNDLPMPSMNDTGNMGARLSENTPITAQDLAFGTKTLKAWIYTSKLILVPWTLLQDSAFDPDTYIPEAAGERIGRILNVELTTGTGTGASMPEGVNTIAPVKVTLSAAGSTPTYDDLLALQHAIDPAYRRNAKYMFNDSTLLVLRKLKDTQNRPLWEPSLQVGAPSVIAGKPYVINNDMPSIATGVKHTLFGDFSRYKVRVARDMSLVRLEERYADNLQTGFFVWCRADGALLDPGNNPIGAMANP